MRNKLVQSKMIFMHKMKYLYQSENMTRTRAIKEYMVL